MKKKGPTTAIVFATYTLADPTTRNTINSISEFFDIIIAVEENSLTEYKPLESKNVTIETIKDFTGIPKLLGFKNLWKWLSYKRTVRNLMHKYRPDMVVTFMLRPLAAIKLNTDQTLVSCIYDIPDPETSGKLDSLINKQGFKNLKNAALVWASDKYKAILTSQFGNLRKLPQVCYNCPQSNSIPSDRVESRKWLRKKLRDAGATIGDEGGTILLRAGAVGNYGGIEETLKAMQSLPADNLFLMMGRPGNEYKNQLIAAIKKMQLEKRAFFWDRPDDETWQNAISGADIGHLLHLEPPANTVVGGLYRYNSSLSNYRLFTYMASGIPVLSYNDKRLKDLHNEIDCFKVLDVDNLETDIAENWKLLSENKLIRETMGVAAKTAFLKKYNWEYQFREIHKFVAEL